MLPFLSSKKQKAAVSQGMIVKDRTPDEIEQEDNDPDAAIRACAQDLIDAVLASNVEKTAQVLKDTFELLESMPHEENMEGHIGEEK